MEQTQTQLALVEEKKAENELEMKREIKYLLESWLQTKNLTGQLYQSHATMNGVKGAVA